MAGPGESADFAGYLALFWAEPRYLRRPSGRPWPKARANGLSVGSTVGEPEDLYSKDGVLSVDFTYQTYQDETGKTYFCFINSDGAESPTLHVRPGDVLKLKLTNLVPGAAGKVHGMPEMEMAKAGEGGCGATNMTASSVNIHYHGTNTPPTCHQDEVIHTLINSGETFQYELHFPKDEPPGLYWYHPHIHGLTTAAASPVELPARWSLKELKMLITRVAGLAERVLVVREDRNRRHLRRMTNRRPTFR